MCYTLEQQAATKVMQIKGSVLWQVKGDVFLVTRHSAHIAIFKNLRKKKFLLLKPT